MLVKYIILVGREEVFLLNNIVLQHFLFKIWREFPYVVIHFIKLEGQKPNDFQLINQSECVIFLI